MKYRRDPSSGSRLDELGLAQAWHSLVLNTNQDANYRPNLTSPSRRINQNVDVVYAGLSLNLTENSVLRLTHLESNLDGQTFYPPGFVREQDSHPDLLSASTSPKVSDVLELNYQVAPADIVSLAHSVYVLKGSSVDYYYRLPSPCFQLSPRMRFSRAPPTPRSAGGETGEKVFSPYCNGLLPRCKVQPGCIPIPGRTASAAMGMPWVCAWATSFSAPVPKKKSLP